MKFTNWHIDRINEIHSEEFYALVHSNLDYISKTFPVTVANCNSIVATAIFLENAIAKERLSDGYHFFIRNLESTKLIGYICVKNIDKRNLKCELAYFIDRDFSRRGIVSAALDDIIAICFSALGMNKILICTATDNRGSQRIAIKNGFKLEGIHRKEFKNGEGEFEDLNYYGLVKSDYHERQVL